MMAGRPPILLLGDIGGRSTYHAGDEAIVSANLDWLREEFPRDEIVLLSKDPGMSSELHRCPAVLEPMWARRPKGLISLRAAAWRRRLPRPFAALAGVGREARRDARALFDLIERARVLFISGGGNLTSLYPAEIRVRTFCALAALAAGVPVVLGAQTLGPIARRRDARLLASWLPRVALLGLRIGSASLETAGRLGVPQETISDGPDDAWTLAAVPPRGGDDLVRREAGEPLVGVSLHATRRGGLAIQDVAALAARAIEMLAAASGARILFLPHAWSARGDGDTMAGEALRDALPGRACIVPEGRLLDRELKWLAARCDLAVTTRYHGSVFALSAGVPCLGLWQDAYTREKLEGAGSGSGLPEAAVDIRSRKAAGAILGLQRRRAELGERLASFAARAADAVRARRERLQAILAPPVDRD